MKVFDLIKYSHETQSDPEETHTLYATKEVALKHLEEIRQYYSKWWTIKNDKEDSFDVDCGNWSYWFHIEEVPVLEN